MSHRLSLSTSLGENAGLISDGALATELEARGCDLNDPLWSAKVLLEQPGLIRDVHRDYFAAGANIATTASYQATPQGFAARGIGEQEASMWCDPGVAVSLAIMAGTFWVCSSPYCNRRLMVSSRAPPMGAATVGRY